MSDFSDRPFVAGSLIGLRAFQIDKLGRLLGPSFPQVFRPGDNEAECRKSKQMSVTMSLGGVTFPSTMFTYLPSTLPSIAGRVPGCPCGCNDFPVTHVLDTPLAEVEEPKPEPPPPPVHTLGGVDCTCGFYAYFDGRNDYKDPSRVAAVIEGYGVCTVGDRGFRASKARLVALVQPKAKVSPLLTERMQHNYPDVPIYATKREAVNAHPLTPPPAPGPEDDDFWTRPVA